MIKNYYAILQIPESADFELIKKAYRKQSSFSHPDTVSEEFKEWAIQRQQELNEAYNILSDPKSREEYDELYRQFFSETKDKNWSKGETNNKEQETNYNEDNPRPWIRFFARYIDLFMVFIVFVFFSYLTAGYYIFLLPSIVLSTSLLLAWVFIEAFLLSTWGTTPGKWLLKIEFNNEKPSFFTALKRSFAVLFKGLGLGLPVLNLITMFYSYEVLKSHKITSWDYEYGFSVVCSKTIGPIRGTVAAIILLLLFILIIPGY